MRQNYSFITIYWRVKKEYKQEQIIYINFDDKENRHLLNINELEKF
jgi:hypothetical protein